jgi:hypothetical protein
MAVGVASWRLDLHDVGAEVGEHSSGDRAPQIGQVDHSQVRERARR